MVRIKDDLDFVLFLLESVSFLICALFFLYANGIASIEASYKIESCIPDQVNLTSFTDGLVTPQIYPTNIDKRPLELYRTRILDKNSWIVVLNFYLYFFIIPLIIIFYFVYCLFFHKLKNPFAKHLNTFESP